MLEFIKQYLLSAIGTISIISVIYFIFWVVLSKKLQNKKIQLSKRAGWSQIKGELKESLISLIGNTLFMLVILSFKNNGLTKFYLNETNFGWYEVLTVILMVLISDTWFYWCHRTMHHPKIYKYVHALHHKSLDINPYTSTSFHTIESLLLTVWVLPLVMVMPVSMTALGIVQGLGSFNNLKSHLGYELFPKFFSKTIPFNMLVTATNHSLHHTQYNGNYGLFFRFWDIVCGTELPDTINLFNEIHLRKNANIIDNTKYKTLTVNKIVKENNNTVSIYFYPTDEEFYNYKAGQYLTLNVYINGKVHHRCFSLSSSPFIDNFLRITVKLNGEVSNYFYNDLKIGDKIGALLPVGDFVFVPKIEGHFSPKHYVMVAGGSGITPLYSMIRQMLMFEPDNKVTLLYANTNENEIIFKEELHNLTQQYTQFQYIDFISGKKRIGKKDLIFDNTTHYYICGSNRLKESVLLYLKDLKVSISNIHIEHFADGYVPWFGILK